MRIGVIRSDIGKIYMADVESRSRRDFPLEPPGNTRYAHKPTDDELISIMRRRAVLTLNGADQNPTVDTSKGANVIRLSVNGGQWHEIAVTSDSAASKERIAGDLNAAFQSLGLDLRARVFQRTGLPVRKFLMIDTVFPSSGLGIPELAVDQAKNGSTLNPVIDIPDGTNLVALTLADLKASLYPSPTSINVSRSNLSMLSTFGYMDPSDLDDMWNAVSDAVAPEVVSTGMALHSLASGSLARLASSSYHPRGLPAGAAVVVLQSDGITPFVA